MQLCHRDVGLLNDISLPCSYKLQLVSLSKGSTLLFHYATECQVHWNFTFLLTSPFYGKSEAGFLGESKIKKTPSPNWHKIPHFRLNTIFLSIFHLIALTNFKKSFKQLLRTKPINFQVHIMANTPQLKALFQNIYYYHFLIYSVPLLGKISEKLMKSEFSKEVYKLSNANGGKMAHFGRVAVFPKN